MMVVACALATNPTATVTVVAVDMMDWLLARAYDWYDSSKVGESRGCGTHRTLSENMPGFAVLSRTINVPGSAPDSSCSLCSRVTLPRNHGYGRNAAAAM